MSSMVCTLGSNAHLLVASIGVSFPAFGEERCPGGEVLLELGVRVLLAAVAAAGGASPGHFEGRRFAGLTGLFFHRVSNLECNTSA